MHKNTIGGLPYYDAVVAVARAARMTKGMSREAAAIYPVPSYQQEWQEANSALMAKAGAERDQIVIEAAVSLGLAIPEPSHEAKAAMSIKATAGRLVVSMQELLAARAKGSSDNS